MCVCVCVDIRQIVFFFSWSLYGFFVPVKTYALHGALPLEQITIIICKVVRWNANLTRKPLIEGLKILKVLKQYQVVLWVFEEPPVQVLCKKIHNQRTISYFRYHENKWFPWKNGWFSIQFFGSFIFLRTTVDISKPVLSTFSQSVGKWVHTSVDNLWVSVCLSF